MKIANIREFRNKALAYLKDNDPVIITRHGKITGVLYPIKETDTLPEDVQKEFGRLLASSQNRERERKESFLESLGKALKIKKHPTMDIEEIRQSWTFTGKLSDEIIAERDTR